MSRVEILVILLRKAPLMLFRVVLEITVDPACSKTHNRGSILNGYRFLALGMSKTRSLVRSARQASITTA
jgi:hypothetical protein